MRYVVKRKMQSWTTTCVTQDQVGSVGRLDRGESRSRIESIAMPRVGTKEQINGSK
jgi:hypothetical protein